MKKPRLLKKQTAAVNSGARRTDAPAAKADRIRFWILLSLLVLSLILAWLINSGLNTALTDQFG